MATKMAHIGKVSFRKGGLHHSLHVPEGQKIPASKMSSARAGNYGPLAKKQAVMATGMLAAGRRTARRHEGSRQSDSPCHGPNQASPL